MCNIQIFLFTFTQNIIGSPDTLICGNCRECFLELGELLDHKRSYCKLRFTCKCQENSVNSSKKKLNIYSFSFYFLHNTISIENPLPSSTKLLCAVCKDEFSSPWDLMVHAQAAHMVNIYELGTESTNNNHHNNNIVDADAQTNNGNNLVTRSLLSDTLNKNENGMICDDDELSDSTLSHHTNESICKEVNCLK